MDTRTLKLWTWWSVVSYAASILIHLDKDVVELNTTANLTCTVKSVTSIYYDSPHVSNVAYCLRSGNCTSKESRYMMSPIDANQTQLYIRTIQMTDEGVWTCKDVNTAEESKVNLYVMRTPSCNVTNNTDLDNLQMGDERSLSISLDDFYCYPHAKYLLQMGEVTEMFIRNSSVQTIESDAFNTTFNVTDSYIGSVKVHFVCNNVNKRIPCGGVKSLQLNNDIDSYSKSSSSPQPPLNAELSVTLGIGIGIGLTVVLVVLVVLILFRRKIPCLSGGAKMFTSCELCNRRDRPAAENTTDMRGRNNQAFSQESGVRKNQMRKHGTETKYTTETKNKTRGNTNPSFSNDVW